MAHLPHLISDLALILAAAGFITLLFKKLKQPVVLGYIIAGFFVGPHFHWLPTVIESESIRIWAEIGVIFLLFSLGLEFSFKKLLKVGGPASITAVFEVVFMLGIGYAAGKILGWSNMDSLFLGGILSISSTTIIIRAFEELGIKTQLFATLVFGVLIVEDLVAVVLMVLLSTLALSQQYAGSAGSEMIVSVFKLVFFLVIWFVAGIFFIPTFLRKTKKLMNEETLLVIAISLCFLMVLFASSVGFSPALGAFIMGSILAETTQAEKIEHLVKPVKDFFGAVFFVSVGMLIDPNMLVAYAGPIVLISVITIAGKFISSAAGSLISGQTLQTSVQTGMSLAQIGEFSFIIATLGVSLKVTSDFLYPIAVAVSAVTTLTTPYMIRFSKPFYKWVEKKLPDRWVASLSTYSGRSNGNNTASDWQIVLRAKLLNMVLLSTLLLCIVYVAAEYFLPYIMERANGVLAIKLTTAFVTLLVMAPFLWALALRSNYTDRYMRVASDPKYKTPLYTLRLLRFIIAAGFIGFLMQRFFSPEVGIIAVLAILILLFLLSKRIQAFYNRIESRFISNYNQREIAMAKRNRSELAPWDAHIVRLMVIADASPIGKNLMELKWRETVGINVVLIKRGEINIPLPGRDEKIYPGDELFILGTDPQIKRLQAIMRPSKQKEQQYTTEEIQISLKEFIIQNNSPWIGKAIRESGIKEKIKGLIVGVERNGQRVLNPESDFVLAENDIVFMVGEEKLLSTLGR
jgi:monovalent cation:H+ antiporter-2, CPA2 family